MPSSVGHALAALALGTTIVPAAAPRRVWVLGAVCAVLPDLDAIGRPFGYPDIGWLGGHRALTHSIAFSIGLSLALMVTTFRAPEWSGYRLRLIAFFASAVLAHGILDAFTTYGAGVAFFAPFSWRRFKSSWEPFWGLWPEVLVIWLPCAFVLWQAWRKHRSRCLPLEVRSQEQHVD